MIEEVEDDLPELCGVDPDDEADPLSGHGWMCHLVDAGVLAAAGVERVRKAELEPA